MNVKNLITLILIFGELNSDSLSIRVGRIFKVYHHIVYLSLNEKLN